MVQVTLTIIERLIMRFSSRTQSLLQDSIFKYEHFVWIHFCITLVSLIITIKKGVDSRSLRWSFSSWYFHHKTQVNTSFNIQTHSLSQPTLHNCLYLLLYCFEIQNSDVAASHRYRSIKHLKQETRRLQRGRSQHLWPKRWSGIEGECDLTKGLFPQLAEQPSCGNIWLFDDITKEAFEQHKTFKSCATKADLLLLLH